MSKPTAVPFNPEHLARLHMREHERVVVDLDALLNVANIGVVWTVFFQDKVLCLCGWWWLWPGVIEVFVIPSIYVPRYPKTFWKYIKQWFDDISDDTHAHRIQTHSLVNEQTDNWMTRLGFDCEGTLQKYTTQGDNYRVWARVK